MTATTEAAPQLSVVVCAERSQSLRPLISSLESQGLAPELELVVVCPSASGLGLGAVLNGGLARTVVVEHTDSDGRFVDLAGARAAGVRAAAAPLVALGETHCFPAPGWAEALVAAHGHQPLAVAGPLVLNANPRTAISWANLLTDYAPWLAPATGGLREELPGHNSCYRRDELLAYGERLGEMLAYEAALHADLHGRGRKLLLVDGAMVRHLNVSAVAPWIEERFAAGRAYAVARSRDWPLRRRAVYVLGGPLIPLVRLRRIAPVAMRTPRRPSLWRLLPVLAAGLVFHAAGEIAGFALGAGRSLPVMTRFELYREDSVHPEERPAAA